MKCALFHARSVPINRVLSFLPPTKKKCSSRTEAAATVAASSQGEAPPPKQFPIFLTTPRQPISSRNVAWQQQSKLQLFLFLASAKTFRFSIS